MSRAQTSPKKIYIWVEESGWQPGANTIAYYPLDGDINDYSGNGRNMSSRLGTITYGTLSGGKKYGIFDGNTIISTTNIAGINTGTLIFWIYRAGSGVGFASNRNQNGSNYYTYFSAYDDVIVYYAPSYEYKNTTNQPTNQRFMYAITEEGDKLNYYENGIYQKYWSAGAFVDRGNQRCIGGLARGTQYYDKLTGYLSNIIIENKVRTAQEISDYYDQTKGDYGIS